MEGGGIRTRVQVFFVLYTYYMGLDIIAMKWEVYTQFLAFTL